MNFTGERQEDEELDAEVQRESIAAADRAIEEVEKSSGDGPRTLTLSNGVRLRLRMIPQALLAAVTARIKDPPVPLADIGKDQLEPNYDDPEYQIALKKANLLRQAVATSAIVARGFVLDHLPDGIWGPDEEEWLDELRELEDLGLGDGDQPGMEIPHATKTQRFVSWISYYLVESEADALLLARAMLWCSGVTEGEVAAAIASFRSDEERGADSGSEPAAVSEDRDNRAARRARGRSTPRSA